MSMACAIDLHETLTQWQAPVIDDCPLCEDDLCQWVRCDWCGFGATDCDQKTEDLKISNIGEEEKK